MVNWKAADATDRLFGSLLAGNPGIKLDYHTMATMFGQGATYDSIEGRFRRYRKIADELRSEAQARGVNVSGPVPRTPRGPRNRVTKSTPSSSSSFKGRKLDFNKEDVLVSPSKGKGKATTGMDVSSAICLDEGTSPEPQLPKSEGGIVKLEEIKTESGSGGFLQLTSPSTSTLPAVKTEKREMDLGFDSVTPAKSSIESAEMSPTRLKTEGTGMMGMNPFGMGMPLEDEDYDPEAA